MLPFNLPLELCEKIFKCLSTKDLLSCMLVNRDFNNYVAQNCMAKILLNINNKNAVEDVLRSQRIYKRVKLIKLDKKLITKVLTFLSPHIIDLDIEDCETCDKKIKLCNLKELTISSFTKSTIFNSLIAPKLKILNIFQLQHAKSQTVSEFMKKSNNIEELNIYLNDTSLGLFEDDFLSTSSMSLKLKSLFISNKSNNDLPSSILMNIEKFLNAQGERLEIISLINSANLILLFRIWNSLKTLKQIFFFTSDPFFDYSMDTLSIALRTNPHVYEIELHSLTPFALQLVDIKIILDATPNLKMLSLWHLRKEIVEFAEKFLKKLKLISYVTIDDDCRVYLKSKNGINDQLRFHQYLI